MKNFFLSQGYTYSPLISSNLAQFLDPVDQQKLRGDARNYNDAEIQNQSSPLRRIDSFSLPTLIKPLQPHTTKVLSSELTGQLKCIYEQLYPTRAIAHMSHFYRQHTRVSLSGDVIGCAMRGSKSSSVFAAYWPGSSLYSTDHTERSIATLSGDIRQHFFVMYSGKSSTLMQSGMDFLRSCVTTVLSNQMHAVSCPYKEYFVNVLLLNLLSTLKMLYFSHSN